MFKKRGKKECKNSEGKLLKVFFLIISIDILGFYFKLYLLSIWVIK